MSNSKLNFKISTGLKNIIGKELINDKFIAVFELIKNSYDAGAKRVDLVFENFGSEFPTMIIKDDGCGMSLEDLTEKWLFVGYSEKKEQNQTDEYRDKIKRKAAGAKGIGRFSCDRLGKEVTLYSKTKNDEMVHKVSVNWDEFEKDDKNEFVDVELDYEHIHYPEIEESGTIIKILSFREEWKEKDLTKLKKSVMKMINPMNDEDDKFEVFFNVTDSNDDEYELQLKSNIDLNKNSNVISGKVENDIFERLNLKTTNILVEISKDGETITSRLEDRGSFIYEIKEKNTYKFLKSIKSSLFALNRSAKMTFTNIMKIEPVKYGSIFVYKNNFRIYPYGEPGNDFFDIDKRKSQGYARFLGSRDLIGRISIKGNDKHFIETSSRNAGFLQTPEFFELQSFFMDKVLKPLEKYVVDIIKWGQLTRKEIKKNTGEIIKPEDVTIDIMNKLLDTKKEENILKIDFNKKLTEVIDIKSGDNLENVLKKAEKIASYMTDKSFFNLIQDIKEKTKDFEKQNIEGQKALDEIKKKSEARKRAIKALSTFNSKDKAIYAGSLHTVGLDAGSIKKKIDKIFEFHNNEISKPVRNELVRVHLLAQKIQYFSEYCNKANFNMESVKINKNLGAYIKGYVDNIIQDTHSIYITVENENNSSVDKFNPKEIAVLVQNVISNSIKYRASTIKFKLFKENEINYIIIEDNGDGLSEEADPEGIFKFGVRYGNNSGSGIGLYHVREIVKKQLKGNISLDPTFKDGFRLKVVY